MLNYRWTADEIVKALQVRRQNQAVEHGSAAAAASKHLTIILHGPGFEDVARDVVRMIERDLEQKRRRGHSAVSFQMPSFVQFDASSNTSTLQFEDDARQKEKGQSSPIQNNTDNSDGSDAIILFTSGTSSSSGAKGVRLSHRSLIVQAKAKLCPPCSYDSQTSQFCPGGYDGWWDFAFPSSPDTEASISFRPDLVLNAVEIEANTLVVVPAMVHSLLLDADKNGGRQYTNLRLLLVGGQSLTANQLERTRRVFPRARVVQTYACTEAGSSITFAQLFPSTDTIDATRSGNATEEHGDYVGHAPAHVEISIFQENRQSTDTIDATSSGSATEEHGEYVGHAPAHIEISIFQENRHKNTSSTMASCPPLESGIIATRGPHVMNGYWQRGNEEWSYGDNQPVGLAASGWLMTNDRGYCDAKSRLYFSGRASDIVRSGGETVIATEVERVIALHPNIEACAVFGLPDEKYGEAVSVAIVLKGEGKVAAFDSDDDSAALLIDIKQHCSNHNLASFKRPKRIFLLKELPANSSGKVLKHKLKGMFSRRRSRL
eukprot:CAMPEP_0178646964 /NCGR_PEP_ID=MMETSP0698-20121128/19661_1 /TAXON_ID=265572 /ORGANISM="Extubocellulus spinifer, Strain CCMP396" /LENGTH=546 /DNA_ID=CAMNT_0020288167 /DNA_START=112 /DNA_END=1754 /DNA_ORIENTATION=-